MIRLITLVTAFVTRTLYNSKVGDETSSADNSSTLVKSSRIEAMY